jgi:hypothetical protein
MIPTMRQLNKGPIDIIEGCVLEPVSEREREREREVKRNNQREERCTDNCVTIRMARTITRKTNKGKTFPLGIRVPMTEDMVRDG